MSKVIPVIHSIMYKFQDFFLFSDTLPFQFTFNYKRLIKNYYQLLWEWIVKNFLISFAATIAIILSTTNLEADDHAEKSYFNFQVNFCK